jgi:hypothetical protein
VKPYFFNRDKLSAQFDKENTQRDMNEFKNLSYQITKFDKLFPKTNDLHESFEKYAKYDELTYKFDKLSQQFKERNLSAAEKLKVRSIEKNHKSILKGMSMNRGFGR